MNKINKLVKKFLKLIRDLINFFLIPFNLCIVHNNVNKDFVLYKYNSYDEYHKTQIDHNIRKLSKIWADDRTLDRVAEKALSLKADETIKGICHGTRNGFEQQYLTSNFERIHAIGTDISVSASEFPLSFVWDFHERKIAWVESFDFVYSNSLDQAWNPKKAMTSWLEQLNSAGLLIVELTVNHGPEGASIMDPFGVRPIAFPYVLSEWFGEKVKISHSVEKKSNMDLDAWLFFISKV
ncbi:MAG: hypothetical protein CBC29_04740 [Methylococcaceae bacterium TMED69]|nr:MAG: hypothetical protein CBC29_04740 [Methylococcaceae bacterium TMED69]|tara:strand:- start:1497 stop:2210 length:714 start_codon:yes stop_codon:yes gene_type:complete